MRVSQTRVFVVAAFAVFALVHLIGCQDKKAESTPGTESVAVVKDSIGGGGPSMLSFTTYRDMGTVDSTFSYMNDSTKAANKISLKTRTVTGTVIADSVSNGFIKTRTQVTFTSFTPAWVSTKTIGSPPSTGVADQPVRVITTEIDPALPPSRK